MMMTAQHTPGPWEAHQGVDDDHPTVWDVTSRHNHRDYGETPKGWFVATVHEVTDEAGAEADARLIAAAPELLEALEAAIPHMSAPLDSDDQSASALAYRRARTAISKARATNEAGEG